MAEEYKFETRCIHGNGGLVEGHPYGAVSVPIFQTATFAHPGIGRSTGYDYTRESNPTRHELESVMSTLEEADDSIACTSGMAAIGLCLELFEEGSHILCTEDLYGGTVRMFESIGEKRGVTFSYVDTSDIELVRKSIRKETKALYIETPSNPTMKVTDFAAMREIADEYGLLIIADNTFLTPYFQKPLTLGADLVVHSGTKFLGGHNDVLAGFVCIKGKGLSEKLRYTYKTVGCCLPPFDSFLVLRGIKTLSVRLERQQENAALLEKAHRGRITPAEWQRVIESNRILGEDLTTLMTAMSFQDLTGQRIKKAVSAMRQLESTVLELYLSSGVMMKAYEEKPGQDIAHIEEQARAAVADLKQKVEGSELKGPSTDGCQQGDIDDLLAQFGL